MSAFCVISQAADRHISQAAGERGALGAPNQKAKAIFMQKSARLPPDRGASGERQTRCTLAHALFQIERRESRALRAYSQPRVGEAGDRAASSTSARSRARSSTRRSAHSRGYLRQAGVGSVVGVYLRCGGRLGWQAWVGGLLGLCSLLALILPGECTAMMHHYTRNNKSGGMQRAEQGTHLALRTLSSWRMRTASRYTAGWRHWGQATAGET